MIVHVIKVQFAGLGIVAGCTRSNGLARGLTVRALESRRQLAKVNQRCNTRIVVSKFTDLDKGKAFEARQQRARAQLMHKELAASNASLLSNA